jgi:hypothetical protein
MVLLHEAISGRADVLILGQKKINHKEILLFCDLNSIYSGIDLKLWNTSSKNKIFSLIFQSFKKIRLANYKRTQQHHIYIFFILYAKKTL